MGFYSESLGLSDAAFTILRDLIHEKTGLFFENGKKDILADKLTVRVIENGFNNFMDYYYKLKYEENNENEWFQLLNCLTVNETYFNREFDHIKLLIDYIIPEYFSNNTITPIKIWSAACSSGEEPLSIAMAINEAGYFEKYPIKIFASDVSLQALSIAKKGLYKERSFRNFPEYLRQKYFVNINGQWQIDENIHKKIEWFTKNLFNLEQFAFLNSSNVIFCRNVFIYFSDEAVKKVVEKFYEGMPKKAYLFVGVSESLLKLSTKFNLEEINNTFFYLKNEK